jgi:hypothetical protein
MVVVVELTVVVVTAGLGVPAGKDVPDVERNGTVVVVRWLDCPDVATVVEVVGATEGGWVPSPFGAEL